MEDQGPLTPVFHRASITEDQRPSRDELRSRQCAAGGTGGCPSPGWKGPEKARRPCLPSPRQPVCSLEDKPLEDILTTQEKEMGLKTKNETPEQMSL